MKNITEVYQKPTRPERVIQFGEGGFLRGFADWMLQKLNDSGRWSGSVVVVQPIEQGMCDALTAQNCLYTHVMRGLENGAPKVQKDVVDCISRCVKPYEDFESYKALARIPEMRFIISNTTEAGIAYDGSDKLSDTPPRSYPAKLTVLLYERFLAGLGGFRILPCELIEKNGETLRAIVCRYAKEWKLGDKFLTWLNEENYFYNTLVDRIVTGHPKDEDMGLDYEDAMVNTSELFHLWVIEGDTGIRKELPLSDIGLQVLFTEDKLDLYRTRKVRILNGAHTSSVARALLGGVETVGDTMANPDEEAFLKKCVYEEILPTLDLPKEELLSYADSVLERFRNPFIRHYWSSIALNSVSKFRVRVLPSLLEYRKRFGKSPEALLQSLGYLLRLYRTDMAKDDESILAFLRTATVAEALENEELWGQNLGFLAEEVAPYAL